MNEAEPDQTDQVKITSVEQLPVKQRRRTDFFCAILFSIYVIVLAIIFIFVYNQTTLDKLTYPTDNSGGLCGYTYPNYPYVYYTSLTDPTKRLCVNQCPLAGQTSLSCKPTPTLGCAANNNTQYQVIIYNSFLSQGRIGLFCLPTDPTLRQQILTMSNTAYKYDIFNVISDIEMAGWMSVILGPLLFLLVHFFPYKVVPWTIFFGGLFSIIFGLLIISLHQGYLIAKILLCVFFVFLGIISLQTMSSQERRDALVVCSRLVHASALTHGSQQQHNQLGFSVQNFKKLGKPVLLILTFALVYFVFFFICVLEGLSAWSAGHLVFKPSQPFLADVGMGSTILFTLLVIQLVWGAFFIKESFNFIVGSHSAFWYYSKDGEPEYLQKVKLLFKYHWGSVLGGSILQGFFYFVDLIFDFFFSNDKPDQPRKDQYNQPLTKTYDVHISDERIPDESNAHCCQDFFNLIRGEALSMVALTNQNYCQAARNCQFLSSNSRFYDYSQITNRIFRINMHIVPMFIVLMAAMGRMGPAGTPYAIITVAFLSFFIITYFVSYHAEKSQGLLISTYVDEALNDGELRAAPRVIEITYREDTMMNQANIKFCDLLCNDSSFAIQ